MSTAYFSQCIHSHARAQSANTGSAIRYEKVRRYAVTTSNPETIQVRRTVEAPRARPDPSTRSPSYAAAIDSASDRDNAQTRSLGSRAYIAHRVSLTCSDGPTARRLREPASASVHRSASDLGGAIVTSGHTPSHPQPVSAPGMRVDACLAEARNEPHLRRPAGTAGKVQSTRRAPGAVMGRAGGRAGGGCVRAWREPAATAAGRRRGAAVRRPRTPSSKCLPRSRGGLQQELISVCISMNISSMRSAAPLDSK